MPLKYMHGREKQMLPPLHELRLVRSGAHDIATKRDASVSPIPSKLRSFANAWKRTRAAAPPTEEFIRAVVCAYGVVGIGDLGLNIVSTLKDAPLPTESMLTQSLAAPHYSSNVLSIEEAKTIAEQLNNELRPQLDPPANWTTSKDLGVDIADGISTSTATLLVQNAERIAGSPAAHLNADCATSICIDVLNALKRGRFDVYKDGIELLVSMKEIKLDMSIDGSPDCHMDDTHYGNGTAYGMQDAAGTMHPPMVLSFCATVAETGVIRLHGCGTKVFTNVPVVNADIIDTVTESVKATLDELNTSNVVNPTFAELRGFVVHKLMDVTARLVKSHQCDSTLCSVGIGEQTSPERALTNKNFYSFHAPPSVDSLVALHQSCRAAARAWRGFFIVFFGQNRAHNYKRFEQDEFQEVCVEGTKCALRYRHNTRAAGETLM